MMFLKPVLISQPSFGLTGETQQETQANIAKTQGFVAAPAGLLNLLAMTCLYLPLSKRLGERNLVLFAGSASVFTTFVTGFLVTKLWQLLLVKCLGTLMIGLAMPVLSPLAAQYANKRFPEQQAQAQGLPMLGLSLGMSIGQPI